MQYTAFLNFWFLDRPVIERVEALARLGIPRVDNWRWRQQPMAELAAECRRLGVHFNSTFDDQMGSLADPADNPLTLRSWIESLEMAERYGVEHLYVFSNQVDVTGEAAWTRRLASNLTPAEQYANVLRQTERLLMLAEQTRVTLWVEALNEFHIQGGVLVHNHALAADWVRRFDHPQLRMVFDCFHQQRDSGNLSWGLEEYAGLYDVVHVADVPTRQEPGTGEINFAYLSRKLADVGYDGLIGLELYPSTREVEVFEKIKAIFSRGG
jgi:hydroxypyruvate isomerase